ncbi:MAG: hypothetical protein FWG71_09070 [Synergistaceae bacterium]|nr:hypothetical protein [Synergistaceae bacterium]
MRKFLVGLLILTVVAGVGRGAEAAAIRWKGGNGNDNWHGSGNWSVPSYTTQAGDVVVIEDSRVHLTTAAGTVNVDRIVLQGNAVLVLNGSSAKLNVKGNVDVGTGAKLVIGNDTESSPAVIEGDVLTIGGAVTGGGTLVFNWTGPTSALVAPIVTGAMSVTHIASHADGTTLFDGTDYTGNTDVKGGALRVGGNFVNAKGATLTVDGTGACYDVGARPKTLTNDGEVKVLNGEIEVTSGSFVNNGVLSVSGARQSGGSGEIKVGKVVGALGSFTNNGTVELRGKFDNEGVLRLNSSNSFNVWGVLENQRDGEVVIGANGMLSIRPGGTVTNLGTISNAGAFYNASVFDDFGKYEGNPVIPGEPPVTPPVPPTPDPDPVDVEVEDIILDKVPSKIKTGARVELEGTIEPSDADVKTITWSITEGSELATLNGYVLTAGNEKGTVVVRARAVNGKGNGVDVDRTKTIEIESSGSSSGCNVGLGAFALAAAALALIKRK